MENDVYAPSNGYLGQSLRPSVTCTYKYVPKYVPHVYLFIYNDIYIYMYNNIIYIKILYRLLHARSKTCNSIIYGYLYVER